MFSSWLIDRCSLPGSGACSITSRGSALPHSNRHAPSPRESLLHLFSRATAGSPCRLRGEKRHRCHSTFLCAYQQVALRADCEAKNVTGSTVPVCVPAGTAASSPPLSAADLTAYNECLSTDTAGPGCADAVATFQAGTGCLQVRSLSVLDGFVVALLPAGTGCLQARSFLFG